MQVLEVGEKSDGVEMYDPLNERGEAFMTVRHDIAQLLKYMKVIDGGDVQHDVNS